MRKKGTKQERTTRNEKEREVMGGRVNKRGNEKERDETRRNETNQEMTIQI